MSLYETYFCPCPRCGYPECVDHGPYIDGPRLGIPADLHLVVCGRCGKSFESGPVKS